MNSSRQIEQELLFSSNCTSTGFMVELTLSAVSKERDFIETEWTSAACGLEQQKKLLMHEQILDMDYSIGY